MGLNCEFRSVVLKTTATNKNSGWVFRKKDDREGIHECDWKLARAVGKPGEYNNRNSWKRDFKEEYSISNPKEKISKIYSTKYFLDSTITLVSNHDLKEWVGTAINHHPPNSYK